MARSLEELLEIRPANEERVKEHMRRMEAELRAYRLRELREASELTQVQLAEKLQVSQNRVSRIEKGDIERTQIDTLRKYVEAVGGQLHIEADFGDSRIVLG